jgi:transcription antitermination factor NusG
LTVAGIATDAERGRSPRGYRPEEADASTSLPWHAVWTRSHCEQLVSDQLRAKQFDVFLPTATSWRRRGGTRRQVSMPLFPGYLFVHHALDKASHVQVLSARGVVKVLGGRWDRLAVVPDNEIGAIQRVVDTGLSVFPHPHQPEAGNRMRVLSGPLAGVEGTFLRGRPDRGLFVVSITLLQRSVAVELDCTQVELA